MSEIDLRRLQYFTVVADELHFGRAASRLNMAQPPLSQQIRKLEAELGIALFTRNTRRVEMTDAGRLLLREAEPVLRQVAELARRVGQFTSGEGGVLRLGFVDSSSYELLPRFLRAYRDRHPEVTYELRSMSSDLQHTALLEREIDLGIARADLPGPELSATSVLREPLLIAVSGDHALASQKSVSLARLADEQMIGFDRMSSPTLHASLKALFATADLSYDPILEAEEYTTILGLVASGQGVGVVPASVQTFQPPGLRYLRLRHRDAMSELLLLRRSDDRALLLANAIDLVTAGV